MRNSRAVVRGATCAGLLALASLLAFAPAAANDSSASLDVGGLKLTHNPNVSVESEDLSLSRDEVRVTVIGNRAFGFIRHNRQGDFRASGSGRIEYDAARVPPAAVRTSHAISRTCGFQSMAYDYLLSREGKPLLSEISYCYLSRAVHDCPGCWDRDLRWTEGHVWPEDAHVDDFLRFIETGEHV